MACLDTTVLLDLVGPAGARKQVAARARLKALEHDRPHSLTRFSLAELFVGFELASDPARERAALEPVLRRLQVLEFDTRSMRLYARIYAHFRALGSSPGVMDMLIAAVALSHGHRFVTRNPDHFRNVPGLRVESY